MTTELRPTDYEGVPNVDSAFASARKAGDGGPIEGFVERIAERVGARASVKAVFGEPIERDGITVIPVAKVRWGFGGGAGSGPVAVGPGIDGQGAPADEAPGFGTGGGGGAIAGPVGYIEIGPDGAFFRPITPPMPSPLFVLAGAVAAAILFRGVARLIRR